MNARLLPQRRLRPLQVADVEAVLQIEQASYGFPWSHGNFIDSLAAGYHALLIESDEAVLLGYLVAMPGVDEMHLLNITVAPDWQGQGLARELLDALELHCRSHALSMLWLEVRESNQRARALYRQRGFAEVGRRRGYYPAAFSKREDAIVMSARVMPDNPPDGPVHALV